MKNWRQKARSPANRLDRPSRLPAGEGREVEVTVAMTNPVFFPAASVARGAFWGAGWGFPGGIFKRRFQLSLSVLILVNGWKAVRARGCPLGAAPLHQRQQISINPLVFRNLDGAPVRLFHAGSDQELSDPQGAR